MEKTETKSQQELKQLIDNLTDEETLEMDNQFYKTTLKDKWVLIKWFRHIEKKSPSLKKNIRGSKTPLWIQMFYLSLLKLMVDKKINHTKSYIEQIKENFQLDRFIKHEVQ
jgi:hypothetical protein